MAEVEKQKKIIKKITSSLEKCQVNLAQVSNIDECPFLTSHIQGSVKAAEEALQEREQEGDELGQIDHLNNRKQQLQDEQKIRRQELHQYKVSGPRDKWISELTWHLSRVMRRVSSMKSPVLTV